MWSAILGAVVKELETNPDRVIGILERILDLAKAHPELVQALVSRLGQ